MFKELKRKFCKSLIVKRNRFIGRNIEYFAAGLSEKNLALLIDEWLEQHKGDTKDCGYLHKIYGKADKPSDYLYTLVYGRVDCKSSKEINERLYPEKCYIDKEVEP